MRNVHFTLPTFTFLCVATVVLSGCTNSSPRPDKGIPVVTVATPVVREVTDYAYFTGRIDAYETVDIRAMVGGYIVKVNFLDGAQVRKGDVLFEIDPRTYQAEYNQAVAQIRVNEAQLNLAETQYDRVIKLGAAATREEKDQKEADLKVAIANLAKAREDANRKLVDLNYTKVLAPRDGVMGKALLKTGNLVKGGSTGADNLGTLVSQAPVFAYFDVDEPTHYKVASLIREGSLRYKYGDTLENLALAASIAGIMASPSAPGGALTATVSLTPGKRFSFYPVWVGIPSEKTFSYRGYIDFVNNQVDASTGTLRLRGILPNDQGKFKPGDFVRVKVPTGPRHSAILIDDKAVGNNLDEKFVYVIGADNKAIFKPVILGGLHGNLREVVKGLDKDDKVVIIGLQRVRPNEEVKARDGKMEILPDAEQNGDDAL